MRTQKFSASQLKCNFCFNWFTIGNGLQPPSGINICEGCFAKARSTASFKILDPTNFELYELQLRKTGVLSDEARSITNQNIAEMAEFYERRGNKEKQAVQILTGNLNDLNTLENQLYACTQGTKDFINNIYRKQIDRVESIWRASLQELQTASRLIDQERERMRQCMSSYTYNFHVDSDRLADKETFALKLKQMRDEASKLLSLDIANIQDIFNRNSSFFYCEGFSLLQANRPRLITLEDECSQFELPDEYAKLEQSIQRHRQQAPSLQKPLKQKDQNIASKAKLPTKLFKQAAFKNGSKSASMFDQQNFLLETPLPLEKMHAGSKPMESFLSNRKDPAEQSARNLSSFGRTNRKPSVPSDKVIYEEIDFKNFRQWPRQKVLELLQRSKACGQHLPKGYKSGDEKPLLLRSYPEKVMTSSICEALDRTFSSGNIIELVGYNTAPIEFLSYLHMLSWSDRTEVVKFVNVGLTDENFNLLLCLVQKHKRVETLVASSNHLTEKCLEMLLNFCRQQNHLKSVYLGRNYISQFKGKALLQQLRALGVTVYV